MTSQPSAKYQSRYVERAMSDLEENRRCQKELASETEMLKREETLLVEMLALIERHKDATEAPPLPEQAQEEATGASTTARRQGRGRTGAGYARGRSQPRLADLLLQLLSERDQPCFANELAEELLAKHPDRSTTPQVVRNTVESLVAKGLVRRRKVKRSVTYTLA